MGSAEGDGLEERQRAFCNSCLQGCAPEWRKRLHEYLDLVVDGDERHPEWLGTGDGIGKVVFVVTPFLFQVPSILAIYAFATPDAVLWVVGVFMFVNIFCILPAECKAHHWRRKQLKLRSKDAASNDDDGDARPVSTSHVFAQVGRVWAAVWLYTALLTLVPAALIVMGSTSMLPTVGVVLFVILLWSIGWIYMWLNADVMEGIEREKRLLRMPADPVIRFKLVAVVIECYVSRLPLPPLTCVFPTRALLPRRTTAGFPSSPRCPGRRSRCRSMCLTRRQ